MKYKFKKPVNAIVSVAIMLLLFSTVQIKAESCMSIYQVTATQLNVRSQSNTLGSIIGVLHKGDELCITQESGNWGKTDSGWVSKKHLQFIGNLNQNPVHYVSTSTNQTSDDDAGNGAIILGGLIVLAFIFFGLKTLFYHTLIRLGMAEPDGRAKNGIRLTRLGKFMASISGLIIFFIIMLIGSMSK